MYMNPLKLTIKSLPTKSAMFKTLTDRSIMDKVVAGEMIPFDLFGAKVYILSSTMHLVGNGIVDAEVVYIEPI